MDKESFFDYLVKHFQISEEEVQELIKSHLLQHQYLNKEEFTHLLKTFQQKNLEDSQQEKLSNEEAEEEQEIETIANESTCEKRKRVSLPTTVHTQAKPFVPFIEKQSVGINFQSTEQRYKILDILGSGGMGVVQRVEDSLLGREVALKRVQINSSINDLPTSERYIIWRLQREAEITAILEHPNIIPLYDMEKSADGNLSFTMRKVEGETLKEIIKKERQDSKEIEGDKHLSVFLKVCDAVAYAHNSGIIHRDIKSENIMVGQFGEVYVMDWGIAKKLKENPLPAQSSWDSFTIETPGDSTENRTIGVLGTPGYMPPEQLIDAAKVTFQSDIYALGKLLRECYTGYSPWEEEKYQKANRETINSATILNPEKEKSDRKQSQNDLFEQKLPIDIRAIIQKATAEIPIDRYQKVQELIADLENQQENHQVSARTYSQSELLLKWSERHSTEILFRFMLFSLTLLLFYVLQIYQEKLIQKKQQSKETEEIRATKFRNNIAIIEEQLKAPKEVFFQSNKNQDKIIRLRTIEISSNKSKKPHLIWQKALEDSNWLIRYRAAERLFHYQEKVDDFLPFLFKALLDPSEYVRYAATHTLSELKYSTATLLEFSFQTLSKEVENDDLDFWITWILKKKNSEELLEQISFKALKSNHWKHRERALRFLATLDQQQKYTSTFIQCLKDPEQKVQWRALLYLQKLPSKKIDSKIKKIIQKYQKSMTQLDLISFSTNFQKKPAEASLSEYEIQLDHIVNLNYILLIFFISQILAIIKGPLEIKIFHSKWVKKGLTFLSCCIFWCQEKLSPVIRIEVVFRNFFLFLFLSTFFVVLLYTSYTVTITQTPVDLEDYLNFSLSIFLQLFRIGFLFVLMVALFEATTIYTRERSPKQFEETSKPTFSESLRLFTQQYSVAAKTFWIFFFLLTIASTLSDTDLVSAIETIVTFSVLAITIHITLLSKYPILYSSIFTLLFMISSSLIHIWRSPMFLQIEYGLFMKIIFNSAYLWICFLCMVAMFEIVSCYSFYLATHYQKKYEKLLFKNRFNILLSQDGPLKKCVAFILFSSTTAMVYFYSTDLYSFLDNLTTFLIFILCLYLFFSKLKIARLKKVKPLE